MSGAGASVHAERVGVRFILDRRQRLLTPAAARLRRRCTVVMGLHELSFAIAPGQGIALLGRSGAGKTTLLRTLAGVLTPDEGRLEMTGRVGSLLCVGAGVLPVLTGRENTLLLGVLAGMSRADARAAVGSIEASSKLQRAFERPVASYSQGMRARLGFAVAEHGCPEILLLDEVHEALDHEFREIVARKAREITAAGGIVVAAGHDHGLLAGFCDRALWLDEGRIRQDGEFAAVCADYRASI